MVYILVILVSIYYGIVTYIHTKHNMIVGGLLILLISLILQLQRINAGEYLLTESDFFRNLRDIAWTILTALGFRLAYRLKK